MYINHESYKIYKRLIKEQNKKNECTFCAKDILDNALYSDNYVYVVANKVPYELWELRNVEDHVMVLPRRHVVSLDQLDKREKLAVIEVIARYESEGYDVFARSPHTPTRSQQHQHTHLIKGSNKRGKGLLFIDRPRVLIKF